jgi:ArsR family transcriptional regulator
VSKLLEAMSCLADDTRLRLLRLLEQHELGVGELGQVLRLPQPTVSRHLKTLSEALFVISRREGTSNLYRMHLADLPATHRDLWKVARDRLSTWAELEQDQRRLSELIRDKMSASRAFFAGAAAEWDRLRSELYGQRFTTDAMLALIPRSSVVADLACGTASVAAMLSPYVRQVIAVDNSPEMLSAARARCAGMENVAVREGELDALPIDDNACDAAMLLLALSYVAEPLAALKEAVRVLKGSGSLVVVDLLPHGREDFRRKMNQVHMGFSLEQISGWMKEAGFAGVSTRAISPEPETKGPALFLARGTRE